MNVVLLLLGGGDVVCDGLGLGARFHTIFKGRSQDSEVKSCV